MIDRFSPETVVGSCSDDDASFVARAMQAAQACGAPVGQMSNANGASCAMPPMLATLGSPVTTCTTVVTTDITATIRKGTFVGKRLILPAEYAAGLRVTAVKVGATPVTLSDDPIFGEAFSSANQRGGELPFIPAPVNQIIVVSVYNETTATIATHFAISGVML